MTDAEPSQPSDKSSDMPPIHWTAIALMGIVALGTGYASLYMSFHGLRDLVERVEGVEGTMSAIGPFGIDGLQLLTLVAIVATAGAPFRVRLYLWIVFFGSIAVSVAMNMVDAAERHAGVAGVILSGFWPALLAAATHVVVVAFRWWQSRRRVETDEATEPATEPGEEADSEPTPKPKPTPTDKQIQAWARQRYAKGGVSCRQVAAAMTGNGYPVSEKQVERWTKDLRISNAQLLELTSGTDVEASS